MLTASLQMFSSLKFLIFLWFGVLVIGRLGDWEVGVLGDWRVGALGGWLVGVLGSKSVNFIQDFNL